MSIEHFTQPAQDFLNDLTNWPAKAKCAVQNENGGVVFGVNTNLKEKLNCGWVRDIWFPVSIKAFAPAQVWGDAQVLKSDISNWPHAFSPEAQKIIRDPKNWPESAVSVDVLSTTIFFEAKDEPDIKYIQCVGPTGINEGGPIRISRAEVFGEHLTCVHAFSEDARAFISKPENWPKRAMMVCQDLDGDIKFSAHNTPYKYKCTHWIRRDGSGFSNNRSKFSKPTDFKKAIVTKEQLFTPTLTDEANRLKKLLGGFSIDAHNFLLNLKNWPEGANGATQDGDGQISFMSAPARLTTANSVWQRYEKDLFRNKSRLNFRLPVQWDEAYVLKKDLFILLYPEIITHFSQAAKEFIMNQDNWPKHAIGVAQGPTGNVLFYSKDMVHEETNNYWARVVDDRFRRTKGIPKGSPPNWRKAKILKTDIFGLQLGEPNTDIQGTKTGRFIAPDPLPFHTLPPKESDKLPTLITNGHWMPFHYPTKFEIGNNQEQFDLEFSGLKDRPISPQRMCELIMQYDKIDRLEAARTLNNYIEYKLPAIMNGVKYRWVPACT